MDPGMSARAPFTNASTQYIPTLSESQERVCFAVKLDRYDLRRRVAEPRAGFTLPNVTMTTVAPIPYDVLKEGIVT